MADLVSIDPLAAAVTQKRARACAWVGRRERLVGSETLNAAFP
jgi:hypothetical protein